MTQQNLLPLNPGAVYEVADRFEMLVCRLTKYLILVARGITDIPEYQIPDDLKPYWEAYLDLVKED